MDRNSPVSYKNHIVWGQARKSLWIETALHDVIVSYYKGQARKSLWIETEVWAFTTNNVSVRLVRACGSKRTNTGSSPVCTRVRLVRACGSKHLRTVKVKNPIPGQARKSLWIETMMDSNSFRRYQGQARKSLWIETFCCLCVHYSSQRSGS